MGETCVLSLDLGTTGLKVGLFQASGALIHTVTREQPTSFPTAGRAEQSPAGTWHVLADAVREAMSAIRRSSVGAISVSNQRGTIVALAPDGTPQSEFIVWMDQRGVPWTEWIRRTVGDNVYYRTCGHPIVSYTGISKVLWLQRDWPEVWERCAVVGSPQTYILRRLGSDALVCDQSTGSFLFPLDIDHKRWSDGLAAQVGYPVDRLPKLVAATDVVGILSPRAARDLELSPGIPLVAGGGDGQCAGIGSGTTRPGRVMINVGTAAGVQTYLPTPIRDPGGTLNLAAHVDPRSWEMEGHTQASGVILRWFRDEFGAREVERHRAAGRDPYELLLEEAALVPAGADGLLLLPTFNGSSAPQVDLHARGSLLGLTLAHGRRHVIRALLEGVAIELRWMLDAILALGIKADEIRLVGGGAKGGQWNQIHADVLNRPVDTLAVPDAALVGAAMCAAVAIGQYQDLDEATGGFVQIARRFEPVQYRARIYESVYENYRCAFSLLSGSGLFRRLARQGELPIPGGSDG
jgi:xylulokinase